eukprot:TRINITY_DN3291_c0_g4_i3.p1 TRINITY_DN3291_c0_g4~~TRINITY_DN3291_c0_g4_i3.p1  ORF type:complete len:330 (+),score=63.31 TRINITY_DN3291_c0_g4_i3:43-1032(+)
MRPGTLLNPGGAGIAWVRPSAAPVGRVVFLAGAASVPWRGPVADTLTRAGVHVVDPFNPRYQHLTAEEHETQCNWELDWLTHPDIAVAFWFPADVPSMVSMYELGVVQGQKKSERGAVFVGADPRGAVAKDVAARVRRFGVKDVVNTTEALAEAVVRGVGGGQPLALTSRPPVLKRGRDYVGVGCGAFVFDDEDRVLLIRRSDNSSIEPGCWARPGGAVELGETCEAALAREMREEVNADIAAPTLTDVHTQLSPNWVAVGYTARLACPVDQVKNMEPNKHPDMGWFALDALPTPLASFVVPILEKMRQDPEAYIPRPALAAKRRKTAA